MPRALTILCLFLLLGCGRPASVGSTSGTETAEPAPATSVTEAEGEAPESGSESAEAEAEAEAEGEGEGEGEGENIVEDVTEVPPSFLSPDVVAEIQRIVATYPNRAATSFAKVGDSMTVNRGYLTCLAGSQVELAGRDELNETIQYFRRGLPGGRDPFTRESLAAAVGWSTHHLLRERPTRLLQEIQGTRARFGTVMLGTNELADRAPRRYLRRMDLILRTMKGRGVVPILSTLPPRGDRAASDRWARRYSRLLIVLGAHHRIPVYDVYQDFSALPDQGLARDGVHATIQVVNNRPAACDFTDEGLLRGHNRRNLGILTQLHHARLAALDTPVPEDPDAEVVVPPAPALPPVTEIPASLELPHAQILRHPQHAEPIALSTIVEVEGPTRLTIIAASLEGDRPMIRLSSEGRRTERAPSLLAAEVPTGTYTIQVEHRSQTVFFSVDTD